MQQIEAAREEKQLTRSAGMVLYNMACYYR